MRAVTTLAGVLSILDEHELTQPSSSVIEQGVMLLPISRLLIVIADRCPWHVLLIDTMSGQLKEQGIACGVVGLVEKGILSAPNIAGLRRLADKTGGAWDLANGSELVDAIKTLGLHLYKKYSYEVKLCEMVVLDHGELSIFRDCIETGVHQLIDALADLNIATQVLYHWQTVPKSRLIRSDTTPRFWNPPALEQPTARRIDVRTDHGCSLPGQVRGGTTPSNRDAGSSDRPSPSDRIPSTTILPQRERTQNAKPISSSDRIIRWGLWLSGGALLSALTLLTKK